MPTQNQIRESITNQIVKHLQAGHLAPWRRPWALALRHMKRVHAHLCNIASSVVQPVHRLDYFDEGALYPPK